MKKYRLEILERFYSHSPLIPVQVVEEYLLVVRVSLVVSCSGGSYCSCLLLVGGEDNKRW